jgi:hypothetical protein
LAASSLITISFLLAALTKAKWLRHKNSFLIHTNTYSKAYR